MISLALEISNDFGRLFRFSSIDICCLADLEDLCMGRSKRFANKVALFKVILLTRTCSFPVTQTKQQINMHSNEVYFRLTTNPEVSILCLDLLWNISPHLPDKRKHSVPFTSTKRAISKTSLFR